MPKKEQVTGTGIDLLLQKITPRRRGPSEILHYNAPKLIPLEDHLPFATGKLTVQ